MSVIEDETKWYEEQEKEWKEKKGKYSILDLKKKRGKKKEKAKGIVVREKKKGKKRKNVVKQEKL